MIKKLDNKDQQTAQEIRSLFQASYKIEAQILNIAQSEFPPLKRPLSAFLESDSEFYGFITDNKVAAIVQITRYESEIDVDSLVVHPEYFRQGLGKKLMLFILDNLNTNAFTVETGLDNKPATSLYEQLGFKEEKQWDTEFGVRKIKFRRSKVERLFVYGSLGLGRPNEKVLTDIGGNWDEGYVLGNLFEDGWGADMGYPGIRLSPQGEKIEGYLFSSIHLKNAWSKLDEFEGEEYLRVKTKVTLKKEGREVEAYIYVLK